MTRNTHGKSPGTKAWWKLLPPFIAALAVLHFAGDRAPAGTAPLAITTKPIASFSNFTSTTEFGAFTWRGGLTLSSPAENFGGLSGLMVGNNCQDLLAISDRGNWFTAKLSYTDDKLSGLSAPRLERMRDAKGKPLRSGPWSDAEAVTQLQFGKIGVAFERQVHIGTYDLAAKGLAAPFAPDAYPQGIDDGPWNGEIESLGQLPSGSFIAIAERQRDASGNTKAWIWQGTKVTPFSIERYGSYNVTDLAVLPDGNVLTIERSFTSFWFPGMAIRRFSAKTIASGNTVKPELLLQASLPLYAFDNMEGIALCERSGETRVTLVSDNNFNTTLQSTMLLQFAYRPETASP